MKRLRELRIENNYTLEYVAKKLGLKNQYVSNYELGKRSPDYYTLKNFANFYSVSVDYLIENTDNPTPYRLRTETGGKADENTSFEDGEYRILFKKSVGREYITVKEKILPLQRNLVNIISSSEANLVNKFRWLSKKSQQHIEETVNHLYALEKKENQ